MHLYESHLDGCYLEDDSYSLQPCGCGDSDRYVCEIEDELHLIAELKALDCADWHIAELVNEYRDRNTKGQVDKVAIAMAVFRSKNILLVDKDNVKCFHYKSHYVDYHHTHHIEPYNGEYVDVPMKPIKVAYDDKVVAIGLAGRCSCGQIYFKEAK